MKITYSKYGDYYLPLCMQLNADGSHEIDSHLHFCIKNI